jgi:hypothetical protein
MLILTCWKKVGIGNRMNTKQLHQHSVPIIVLSVGLFLASVLGVSQFLISVGPHSQNSLVQIFSERLFTIHPTSNGLFKISRYGSSTQADVSEIAQTPKPTGLNTVDSTGEVANMTVTLESANAQADTSP